MMLKAKLYSNNIHGVKVLCWLCATRSKQVQSPSHVFQDTSNRRVARNDSMSLWKDCSQCITKVELGELLFVTLKDLSKLCKLSTKGNEMNGQDKLNVIIVEMIYLQDHMVIASFVKPKPSSTFNVWFINLQPMRLKDVRCVWLHTWKKDL